MSSPLTQAERRERTTDQLIVAAERHFVARGYHATSLDQIAAEAGYTKGAVYSNFASKDDLFLAVYERRTERAVAELERTLAELGPLAGLERIATEAARRRGRDDGWLAVFFEFWAHVVRHPVLRERFAEIHARFQAPAAAAGRRYVEERGGELPEQPEAFNVAMMAMQLGLSLERLTQPDVVDEGLGARMTRFVLEGLARDTVAQGEEEKS